MGIVLWSDGDFDGADMTAAMSMNELLENENFDAVKSVACNPRFPKGVYVIACHEKAGKHEAVIFNDADERACFNAMDDIAETLLDMGWNNETIIMLSCRSGAGSIESTAQEIADQANSLVIAPLSNLWVLPNGAFYVASERISNADSAELSKDDQKSRWEKFTPIVR